MNIAIVDDLATDSTYLCTLLEKYSTKNNIDVSITTFSSGIDFLDCFEPNKFDVAFLDIYMPKITGIELAKQFFEKDPNCHIIFITSSSDFAVESYDVNALYYIIKPISEEKLDIALKRCQKTLLSDNKYIDIPYENCSLKIFFRDILYIENHHRKLTIHTTKTNYTFSISWSNFITSVKLDERFLECFRGIIVNMDHISKVLEIDFLLDNDEKVPLRQRSRSQLKKQYMDYMFNHLK